MPIIEVNRENISAEHICCAITDAKGDNCVALKKQWMTERFDDGLVFRKLDERGKVFIEYIPAENAWAPIDAPGYLFIDCMWVSGKFQHQGYAGQLLAACVEDAESQGKNGVAILSAAKKMPFLSDPNFLKHKGFVTADKAGPYFELLYLPLRDGAPPPRFKESARAGTIGEQGMVLYYANQCPFAEKYAHLVRDIAERKGAVLKLVKLETKQQAQAAPSPFTSYSFFDKGRFVTNEIFGEKKFLKYLAART